MTQFRLRESPQSFIHESPQSFFLFFMSGPCWDMSFSAPPQFHQCYRGFFGYYAGQDRADPGIDPAVPAEPRSSTGYLHVQAGPGLGETILYRMQVSSMACQNINIPDGTLTIDNAKRAGVLVGATSGYTSIWGDAPINLLTTPGEQYDASMYATGRQVVVVDDDAFSWTCDVYQSQIIITWPSGFVRQTELHEGLYALNLEFGSSFVDWTQTTYFDPQESVYWQDCPAPP